MSMKTLAKQAKDLFWIEGNVFKNFDFPREEYIKVIIEDLPKVKMIIVVITTKTTTNKMLDNIDIDPIMYLKNLRFTFLISTVYQT